jgi:predicted Ser/Thr protein kinase
MNNLLCEQFIAALNLADTNRLFWENKAVTWSLNEQGKFIKSAGKNSFVFKATINSAVYAVKCYTTKQEAQTNNLKEIASFLEEQQFDWAVPFSVYSKPLPVKKEGELLFNSTVVLMPWIEGNTLEQQVKILCEENDKEGLNELFLNFIELSNKLLKANVSHGDITPDNIIVNAADGKLYLVDYDTFSFNEETRHFGQFGWTPAYHHPCRRISETEIFADHFSILLLTISLKAFSLKPDLYKTFTSSHGLLFTVADFKNIDHSNVAVAIAGIEDSYLETALDFFKIVLTKNSCEIPQLQKYLNCHSQGDASSLLQMKVNTLTLENEIFKNKIKAMQGEMSWELIQQEKLKIDNKKLRADILKYNNAAAGVKQKKTWRRTAAISTVILLALGFTSYLSFFTDGGISGLWRSAGGSDNAISKEQPLTKLNTDPEQPVSKTEEAEIVSTHKIAVDTDPKTKAPNKSTVSLTLPAITGGNNSEKLVVKTKMLRRNTKQQKAWAVTQNTPEKMFRTTGF